MRKIILIFLIALWLLPTATFASVMNSSQQELLNVSGKVIDAQSKKPLVFASVTLSPSGISIVTNGEGYFSIKFPKESATDTLNISFIGYSSFSMGVGSFIGTNTPLEFRLEPTSYEIESVVIRPQEAVDVVKMALASIPVNYPEKEMGFTAFYREMIKKRNTYVTLTEAALEINKASYTSYMKDKSMIYKGRGSVDKQKIDTVFVKFMGGISADLVVDQMKNTFLGVTPNLIDFHYSFNFESPTYLDDVLHAVVFFTPKNPNEEILLEGKLYINVENFAVTRIEMGLKIEPQKSSEATSLFIKKKPRDLRINLLYASYLVQYKRFGEKYLFDYSRTEIKFDSKWKSKIFKTPYTIISEMAVTDIDEEGFKIASDERIRHNDITLDRVEDFKDDEFWKDYNVIEPEAGIYSIIKKIKRRK